MKTALIVALLIASSLSKAHEGIIEFNHPKISLDLLRKNYAHLSQSAFNEKLKAALERPLMFFRSYPNTYYADTKINTQEKILCLGDAHPENFGFMLFGDEVRYLFNDLDDSGFCPVELDVLRYFSALRLMGTLSPELLVELATEYEKYLTHDQELPKLTSNLIENLDKKRRKNLEKYTKENLFIAEDELVLIDGQEKSKLLASLAPNFKELKLHDIAINIKQDGGSGGLKRYWILVEDKNDFFDILELKTRARPATSWWSQDKKLLELSHIGRTIWGQLPNYFAEVSLATTPFQVRSRSKDDINLNKLNAQELRLVLGLQTALLAQYHRNATSKKSFNLSAKWILEQSKEISIRYKKAFYELKNSK